MLRIFIVLSFLIGGSAVAAEPNAAQKLIMREVEVDPADQRLFYDSHLSTFGDLRLPEGKGPHPVAMVIHGGAWQAFVSLHYISALADALTCAGFATWNIEYRRIGGHGEWPNLYRDVAGAADFLRSLPPELALDLGRVITIGHSAGGHLALWAAGRHRLPEASELYVPDPLPVRGVISLAGPGDIPKLMETIPQFSEVLMATIGGDRSRLSDISPAALLPLGVPQVFISGSADSIIPPSLAEDFAAQARARDDQVETHVLDGDHFISTDPWHPIAGPLILKSALTVAGEAINPDRIARCTAPRS